MNEILEETGSTEQTLRNINDNFYLERNKYRCMRVKVNYRLRKKSCN